jgi:hypothetical protein
MEAGTIRRTLINTFVTSSLYTYVTSSFRVECQVICRQLPLPHTCTSAVMAVTCLAGEASAQAGQPASMPASCQTSREYRNR